MVYFQHIFQTFFESSTDQERFKNILNQTILDPINISKDYIFFRGSVIDFFFVCLRLNIEDMCFLHQYGLL